MEEADKPVWQAIIAPIFPMFLFYFSNIFYNTNIINRRYEMSTRIFTAFIYKEDELYVAECPEVGTVSQGYTIQLRRQLKT